MVAVLGPETLEGDTKQPPLAFAGGGCLKVIQPSPSARLRDDYEYHHEIEADYGGCN